MRYFKCLDAQDANIIASRKIQYKVPHLNSKGKIVAGNKMRKLRSIPRICTRGYHLAKETHIIEWLSSNVYEAIGFGLRDEGQDKIAFQQVQLVKKMQCDNKIICTILIEQIIHLYHEYFQKGLYKSNRSIFLWILLGIVNNIDDWKKFEHVELNRMDTALASIIETNPQSFFSNYCTAITEVAYSVGLKSECTMKPYCTNYIAINYDERKRLNDRTLEYLDCDVNVDDAIRVMRCSLKEEINKEEE